MKPKPQYPKTIRTLQGIANLIATEFNISCDRTKIKTWQTHRSPPFPSPDITTNAFVVKECFDWVRAYVKEANKATEEQVDLFIKGDEAKARLSILKAEREAWEMSRDKGEWVPRGVAEHTLSAALRTAHAFVRVEVEVANPLTRKEKLQQLGIIPEVLALFLEWDLEQTREVIDKIENRYKEASA